MRAVWQLQIVQRRQDTHTDLYLKKTNILNGLTTFKHNKWSSSELKINGNRVRKEVWGKFAQFYRENFWEKVEN